MATMPPAVPLLMPRLAANTKPMVVMTAPMIMNTQRPASLSMVSMMRENE